MISSRIFDEVSGGRGRCFRSNEASSGFVSDRLAVENRDGSGKAQMENPEQNADACQARESDSKKENSGYRSLLIFPGSAGISVGGLRH